ncbi:MAG: hypothetical protein WKF87_17555 [Chryseolinea sp.]
MKNSAVKYSTSSKEVEGVGSSINMFSQKPPVKRIDEEGLFGYFTASIIKMKIKFTR